MIINKNTNSSDSHYHTQAVNTSLEHVLKALAFTSNFRSYFFFFFTKKVVEDLQDLTNALLLPTRT